MIHSTAEFNVPRYDKSLFGGAGDRAPASQWPRVSGPLDLVILEGWMLGYEPEKQKQSGSVATGTPSLLPQFPGMEQVGRLFFVQSVQLPPPAVCDM